MPTRSIVYVRNPAWKASTDPVRKAYVNEIKVSETGNQTAIQQQLQTNTAAASMECDYVPTGRRGPRAVAQMKQGLNHNFNLGSTYSTNPYIVFNTVSPNNGNALKKVAVRQALSYGINRAPPAHRQRRPDPGGAAHPRAAVWHQRGAGPAGRLQPVPVQPDQGQADAGQRRGTRTG